MNLVSFALRRPISLLTMVVAVALVGFLALDRMSRDIFPDLGVPVLYVAQPYGGMDPAQMEGFITNYYEYHFLYITGIEHVESKSIQGVGADQAPVPSRHQHGAGHGGDGRLRQPRPRLHAHGHRAAFRDALRRAAACRSAISSSPARPKQSPRLQDAALFKVRPLFATLPGVSAPPPFGASQRTIVVRVDPDKLRAYNMSPDEVVQALPPATRSAHRATSASATSCRWCRSTPWSGMSRT